VGAGLAAFGMLLLSACATHPAADSEVATDPVSRGELFWPSQDSMADVERAIEKAAAGDKLALVILGANWCHDSRALAARIHQAPLAGIISAQYEPVFVDIAYLDQGQDVARALGTPIYYATPTVLIVDPVSRRLVNAGDRHQWGAADSISMDESVDYFTRMAQVGKIVQQGDAVEENVDSHPEIDAYEERLAVKVARGYDRVGPMLRAYKEAGEVPASFEDDWTEVADFRKSVPGLIEALRAEAKQHAANKAPGALELPPIPPYSWE
jgi:thiol-disulfide isomerase/thioredoxin